MKSPVVPVMANVTASPITDPEEIRARLVEQVTGTVRWRECMLAMTAGGVSDFFEVGTGKVLSGLVRRIDASASGHTAGTPEEIAALGAILNS